MCNSELLACAVLGDDPSCQRLSMLDLLVLIAYGKEDDT